MGNYKRETTRKRHIMVFYHYIKVLKDHGSDAKYISKGRLYELAGEPFGYDADTAARIVRRLLEAPGIDINDLIVKEDALKCLEEVLNG